MKPRQVWLLISFGLFLMGTIQCTVSGPAFNAVTKGAILVPNFEPSNIPSTRQIMPLADTHYDFDLYVPAYDHHSFYGSFDADTAMYGHFDVESGTGLASYVSFYILDEYNYGEWTEGRQSTGEVVVSNRGSLDWTFIAPRTDNWYIVYDNSGSFYQAHVVGWYSYDVTSPTISCNLEDSATYAGIKQITASATDDGFGVVQMRLQIDGTTELTVTGDTLSFSWDTTAIADGEHTVQIIARDGAQNTRSVQYTVNVSNLPGRVLPIIAVASVIGMAAILTIIYLRGRVTIKTAGASPDLL